MNGIEVKNISKYYGKACALDNINCVFEPNKIYGLLGRNGAGKTTLLNIMSNRIFATSGEVTLEGKSLVENDYSVGQIYLTSEKTYYPESNKVKDIFKATQQFYPSFDMEYAYMLADKFCLNTNKTVGSLSTGFVSILKLVIALSVNVPYIFFDEPVLGLDANNRDLFYKLLLQKYIDLPCTIVISTHLIEEVSAVIEELVIIRSGRIMRAMPREELIASSYAVSGAAAAVEAYAEGKVLLGCDTLGGYKTAYIQGHRGEVPSGLEITAIELQKLFILMTNNGEVD